MTKEQWLAIKDCDKKYDGVFFYALKTTKTVCRPSCTARTPNPKNIVIFYSVEAAVKQGFRPCNRCRADFMDWQGAREELSSKAKEYIEINYAEKFSLREIAKKLYIDPSYLLRAFKYTTGHTLLWYQNYIRIKIAQEMLINTKLSVSFISDNVGYNSISHFSRVFKKLTSYSPTAYRSICNKNEYHLFKSEQSSSNP